MLSVLSGSNALQTCQISAADEDALGESVAQALGDSSVRDAWVSCLMDRRQVQCLSLRSLCFTSTFFDSSFCLRLYFFPISLFPLFLDSFRSLLCRLRQLAVLNTNPLSQKSFTTAISDNFVLRTNSAGKSFTVSPTAACLSDLRRPLDSA